MSLHTHGEATATERIYHFRCKCGRVGTRRSRSRLVKLDCRDCGAAVEWWQSTPIVAFSPPELSVEMTAAQLEEIRADRDTWRGLSRKAVVGDEGDRGDEAPHAADAARAPAPACSTTAIRDAAKQQASDEREQLALGDFLATRDEGI